jgi:hypothetical protein
VTVFKLVHLFHVGQVVKRKETKPNQEPVTYPQAQVKAPFKKGRYNKAEA